MNDIFKTRKATFKKGYGPKIWNALPYRMKISENINSFKAIVKYWNGNHCACRDCKHTTSRQWTLIKTSTLNSLLNLMHNANFGRVNLS